MAISFLDVCRFNPSASGTADFLVSGAVTGYQTPSSAGALDGGIYRYRAESADLSQWEVGYGAYSVSTSTLARTTILFSSASNAKVSFTTAPQVAIVGLAEDLTAMESGAAKAWVNFAGRGSNGACTINASYNVSGVSRTATGVYVISFSTSFSSANFAASAIGLSNSNQTFGQAETASAGSVTVLFWTVSATALDPTAGMVVCFGNQ